MLKFNFSRDGVATLKDLLDRSKVESFSNTWQPALTSRKNQIRVTVISNMKFNNCEYF